MPEGDSTQSTPNRGIEVDSDWLTTLWTILLLPICVLLLVREVRHFFWGTLRLPAHFQISFWSIWNALWKAIALVYCFIFATRLPTKSAQFASMVAGACFGGSLSLSFIWLPPSAQHMAALLLSLLWQIALVLSCVAIGEWFRSVLRSVSSTSIQGGDN